MNRREFIQSAAAASAFLSQVGLPFAAAAKPGNERPCLVDTNVTLMQWPMRRLPLDDSTLLARKLWSQGVTEAWAGSFEALLQRDLAAVNSRLNRACKAAFKNVFVPFGSVNPAQSWWREDLRRCHEEHGMPGIRLYPGYHGYTLADPACAELLHECAAQKLIVQVVVTIEDERVQHPRLKASPVDLKPLSGIINSEPALRLVLLNWNRAVSSKAVPTLVSSGQVWIDIATQEGVAGISNLLKQVSASAIVFGSNAPYYYFESALFKLKESELQPDQVTSICYCNAKALRNSIRSAA